MKTTQKSLVSFSLGALFLASSLLATSCSSSSGDSAAPQQNLAQTLETEGLTTLRAALQRVGLLEGLAQGTLTVFGPSNAAFEQLPEGFLDGLTHGDLTEVLLYHMVSAAVVSSAAASGREELPMANGDDAIVDVVGGALQVNEARVSKADVQATNGVLHVIDRVLLPPTDLRRTFEVRGLENLLAAYERLQGDQAPRGEGGFKILTLLGPTDEAFDAVAPGLLSRLSLTELYELLGYHAIDGVVPASAALTRELVPSLLQENVLFGFDGNGGTVNQARLSLSNIPYSDGVLHIIDGVLLRPDTLRATLARMEGFRTFTSVLRAASMDGILDGPTPGPFTVFAPSDAAFAALPDGLLDALLDEPGTPTLIQIVQYHMVEGALTANAVAAAAGTGISTLEGGTLSIDVGAGGIAVDGAHVLTPNVLASNGILHTIDAVLWPESVVLP